MREPSINFSSILILIGSAQGLFFALALAVMRKGNRRANFFLAGLLVTLSAGLIDGFLNVTNYYSRYPNLIGVVWPASFLIGPFLYFYVRELSTSKGVIFSGEHFLHYLPAIACALLLVPFYGANADIKIQTGTLTISPIRGLHIFSLWAVSLLIVLQKAVYYILSYLLIRAYSASIKQSFSSLEKISLSWLRTLLLLFFSLCFVFTFFSFCATPFGVLREAGYLFYFASALITYVIAFKALTQPEIFSRLEAVHRAEIVRIDQAASVDTLIPSADLTQEEVGLKRREKYQKSSLTAEQASEIRRQLTKLMKTERLFLEPELTLPDLSEKLAVSPHHLSQVINGELNASFFDFVNEYRVEEAKRLLRSPEFSHLSILGIALDAGFNSKSAFYTAFGKYAGMTPSEFRKQQTRLARSTAPDLAGRI